MQRRADVYIELALLALGKLPRYLGGRDVHAYLADDYCQSAVERQLEIAGDALGQLRKIAPEVFGRIPDGDLIVAFRNVLAHDSLTGWMEKTRPSRRLTLTAPSFCALSRTNANFCLASENV